MDLYREVFKYLKDGDAEIEAELVRRELSEGPSGRWLDVGCGYGRHLAVLGDSVVGVDVNLEYLREASKFGDVVQGDAHMLPFRREAFAGAYMLFSTLEMLDDPAFALLELTGSLKRGARVIIDVSNAARVLSDAKGVGYEVARIAGPYRVVTRIVVTGDSVIEKLEVYNGGGKHLGSVTLRLKPMSLRRLVELTESASMRLVKAYGGFRGEKLTEYSPRIVAVAIRL